MDCPTCGYVMDDFEAECPRCVRMKALGRDPAAAVAANPALTAAEQVAQVARNAAGTVKVEPLIRLQAPELGWLLTIVLWLTILLNVGIIVITIIASTSLRRQGVPEVLMETVKQALLQAGIWAGIRIVCLGGILKLQRWGLFIFYAISVLPGLVMIFNAVFNWYQLAAEIIPAMAILSLTFTKWDQFE